MSITIYSTSDCAECHSLTKWLDSIGQTYDKKVTDEDAAAMTEFMSVNDGMISVPLTIISDDSGNQTKISGFKQGQFKQALGL